MKNKQFNDYLTILFSALNFGDLCLHFINEVIRKYLIKARIFIFFSIFNTWMT